MVWVVGVPGFSFSFFSRLRHHECMSDRYTTLSQRRILCFKTFWTKRWILENNIWPHVERWLVQHTIIIIIIPWTSDPGKTERNTTTTMTAVYERDPLSAGWLLLLCSSCGWGLVFFPKASSPSSSMILNHKSLYLYYQPQELMNTRTIDPPLPTMSPKLLCT